MVTKQDKRRGPRRAFFDGCDTEVGHSCDGLDAISFKWSGHSPFPLISQLRIWLSILAEEATNYLKIW